jgi:hypothetical protein
MTLRKWLLYCGVAALAVAAAAVQGVSTTVATATADGSAPSTSQTSAATPIVSDPVLAGTISQLVQGYRNAGPVVVDSSTATMLIGHDAGGGFVVKEEPIPGAPHGEKQVSLLLLDPGNTMTVVTWPLASDEASASGPPSVNTLLPTKTITLSSGPSGAGQATIQDVVHCNVYFVVPVVNLYNYIVGASGWSCDHPVYGVTWLTLRDYYNTVIGQNSDSVYSNVDYLTVASYSQCSRDPNGWDHPFWVAGLYSFTYNSATTNANGTSNPGYLPCLN